MSDFRLINAGDLPIRSIDTTDLPDDGKGLMVVLLEDIENADEYIVGENITYYINGYKAGRKDFERPKGKWIIKSNGTTNHYICDQCNNPGDIQDNFCRVCGADMRGEEE